MAEHCPDMAGVEGSIPSTPKIGKKVRFKGLERWLAKQEAKK